MNGALKNLIRVHRWTLDERRRTLVDLERMAEKLKGDLAELDAELERERQAAIKAPEMAFTYPAFASAARQRKDRIRRSIEDLGKEIDRAREQVEDAFQELKKYEMALEAAERRQLDKLKRREQAALDEMGLAQHLRKKASEGG